MENETTSPENVIFAEMAPHLNAPKPPGESQTSVFENDRASPSNEGQSGADSCDQPRAEAGAPAHPHALQLRKLFPDPAIRRFDWAADRSRCPNRVESCLSEADLQS